MKVKIRKEDRVFSLLVRERVNWHCESCGANHYENRQTLQCAHLESRRHTGTRLHPRNAVALCFTCHRYFTEHPFDWTDWCRDKFGGDFIAELRRVANTPVKWTKRDREDIYTHLKAEYKKMLSKRQNEVGRIDFDAAEIMHVFQDEVSTSQEPCDIPETAGRTGGLQMRGGEGS